jgi:hypothetical protein
MAVSDPDGNYMRVSRSIGDRFENKCDFELCGGSFEVVVILKLKSCIFLICLFQDCMTLRL